MDYNHKWEFPQGGLIMSEAIHQYDTRIDSKKRITLRKSPYEYYHVVEYDDGRIILEPRVLAAPFQVSASTLTMMDEAMDNLKNGIAAEPVDLSGFGGD